ncbi:hypothetical protein FOIG_13993 [Fusarium odoratissimum NRRL 54006]|uniref:Uncharacterized protein n=1 Tax=Fusarium odoratissimum (strain NRRL 54006) TaxID=1089451 RepID=X0IVZ3_FUSO5|nr:uncharacterized protein FOIG_13993 [Fusarium odoratissimum NRRL 54006]EXL93123.1 hypothetical protein FOIG_13993 [Fusarium odoratissimum NRRL 54006]
MARKKEARLTASEDEPQCQNGAPIFVEMIAEARAYPSAVYQGIRKLPGRCSCPCLKTLPIPAQRPPAPGPQVFGHFGRRSRDKEDRASPSLCRSVSVSASGVSFELREAVIDGYVLYRLFYGLPRMDPLCVSTIGDGTGKVPESLTRASPSPGDTKPGFKQGSDIANPRQP